MELVEMTLQELKGILSGEIFMLPSNLIVLPFKTYLDYEEIEQQDIISDIGKLNCCTLSYIDVITDLNKKHSETFVPYFKDLEDFENNLKSEYLIKNFDANYNYIEDGSFQTLKSIIIRTMKKASFADNPYYVASGYDFTVLFDN